MSARIGSLFSGSGMLDEGACAVLGGDVAWHAEVAPAASKVLAYRYPGVPNLGDITAIDWATVEPVDVITGGSPCQDVSHAGKRAGMRAGTRSGLWARMCDAIETIRPAFVVWENVRGVLSAGADSAMERCPGCMGDGDDGPVLRALGRVLGDLAELGYDASWHGLRAADVGAPHGRFRVFVLAWDANGAAGRISGHGGSGRASGGGESEAWEAVRGVADRASAIAPADAYCPRREGNGAVAAGPQLADALGDRGAAANSARGAPVAGIAGEAAANAGGFGQQRQQGLGRDGRDERVRREEGDHARDGAIAWGDYEPAIRRWEAVLSRPAPAPTEPGPRGGQRLSPRLTEWMMGWPDGWVTDVPGISRNDALKICGNGVVPQQAAEAIRRMLTLIEAMSAA